MKTSVLAGASLIAILLAAQSSFPTRVWARQAPGGRASDETRLILALNDCLQERFRDIDDAFGIRRIVRTGETPHRFKPENVRELSAVENLERAQLRVILYLAGRRSLRVHVDVSNATRGSMWALIKGPALVTEVEPSTVAKDRGSDPPPEPVRLLNETRRAMAAFAHADVHEFVVGRWKFVSHPVRARDATCLNCHREQHTSLASTESPSGTPLRIGDPLGVVHYGYQPIR